MNGMNVVAGATGLMLVAYVVLITVGITGAICSIIGLVRGISSRNTTAIAFGGVGVGCAVLGVFVFPMLEIFQGNRAPTSKFLTFPVSLQTHEQMRRTPNLSYSILEQEIVRKHSFWLFKTRTKSLML